MNPPPVDSARDRVLFLLKTRGAQTAADLAARLEVTPMAVRQHLAALSAEGLVASSDERRKVGRPARLWSLTDAASQRFPDTHAELTVDLLKALRTTFGEEGLDRLVTERGRQQREMYAARMPTASVPVQERIAALAQVRAAEGYMAEWTADGDGAWLLLENHCPVCAAARVCQGFCRDELEMFRALLGAGVTVTRTEHVLAGARRCAYRIEENAGAAKGANAKQRDTAESTATATVPADQPPHAGAKHGTNRGNKTHDTPRTPSRPASRPKGKPA